MPRRYAMHRPDSLKFRSLTGIVIESSLERQKRFRLSVVLLVSLFTVSDFTGSKNGPERTSSYFTTVKIGYRNLLAPVTCPIQLLA